MTKPTVHFNSRGPSGNIYHILGLVQMALRKQRRINDYNETWERVQKASSYREALQIIREKVDLVDDDGVC